MNGETIVAIATPMAPGGIGILRISGETAFEVAQKIFVSKKGKKLGEMKPFTATLGRAVDGGEPIDECIALVFRAPHSYTGEDVVELSAHGGPYIMKRLLEAAIKAGARLAQPGEFTKRAYLNGRMDLTSAEAVMDLILAKGQAALRAAQAQHEGAMYKNVQRIKETLTEISSDIAAYIDFPEEDLPALRPEQLKASLEEVFKQLNKYIGGFEKGRLLRGGVDTVIAGKPNVGKSTLMNLLAGARKSIVTDIPGTTRDVVEDTVTVGGIVLNLADTAGLRESENPIERLGVGLAREKIENAQLILAVFDASMPLEKEDYALLQAVRGRNAVAVFNKTDLPKKIQERAVLDQIKTAVYISALSGSGLSALEEAVVRSAGGMDFTEGMLFNERQLDCAAQAADGIRAAIETLDSGFTLDAVSTGIEQALRALARLTGENATEETLERVFSKFCVGK